MSKILIIENEHSINEMLKRILKHERYRILQAYNGREGLVTAIEHPIDLIICDIKMPLMSGWEFITILKQAPQLKKIPIIFLTAKVQISNQMLAERLGVDSYQTKPFDIALLLPRIKGLIARKTVNEADQDTIKQLFLTGELSTEDYQTSYTVNLNYLIETLSEKGNVSDELLTFLEQESDRITDFFRKDIDPTPVFTKEEVSVVYSIDDDPLQNILNGKLIKKVLPHAEYQSFLHPVDFLNYLQENPNKVPQLLLLDIYLPFMNGFEIVRELHDREYDIPSVMISATNAKDIIQKAIRLKSVIAFMGKPLEVEKLERLFKNA